MGATFPFTCSVEGCSYATSFRLGMGEELSTHAHAERLETLRAEHPNHPPVATGPADDIKVGEPFALNRGDVGDCPGIYRALGGLIAMCVLDEGHSGVHVATDGRVVVEVWA